MFRHPAWAVDSFSSGPSAARVVGTKSTGGFANSSVSPCRMNGVSTIDYPQLEVLTDFAIHVPPTSLLSQSLTSQHRSVGSLEHMLRSHTSGWVQQLRTPEHKPSCTCPPSLSQTYVLSFNLQIQVKSNTLIIV